MITNRYAAKLDQRALALGLLSKNADERTLAQRQWLASLRPTQEQRACDIGLFSDDSKQTELFK